MGNCVKRETGLDIDEDQKKQEKEFQEVNEKIVMVY